MFDLTTLEDANFPMGSWSGNGVTGTTIDPSGLVSPVTLTFTPMGNCALPSNTTITLNEVPEATLSGNTAICSGDIATLTFNFTGTGPFDVVYQDGSNNQFPLNNISDGHTFNVCLLYTSPSPRDQRGSRMPSSA